MSFAVTVKDAQDLRKLIPLNILSANRFEALCAEVGIEEVPRGGVLFRQGDAKNEFVYVLSGTVSLQAGGMEMEEISGGSESARFALAHQIPRKVSAVAKDRVRFIRVDATYVNQPSENVSAGKATYEVSDMVEDGEDDWVTTLLKSPIFQRLPPANLQNILSLLEEVPVKAGQEIVRQDEPGDYYYVIKRGRCALTRKPSRLAREVKLAELKTCDTFGEDSLISDQPRNVTVTMKTDGLLLRLSKANFLKLVKEPVIAYVSMDVAQRMIQQGAAWLDVRTAREFDEGHLPDSINIPFFQLRMELPRLNRNVKCILVCEMGRLSEAAAFLLIRHEFDAYVLKGGISGVFKDQLVSGGGVPKPLSGTPEGGGASVGQRPAPAHPPASLPPKAVGGAADVPPLEWSKPAEPAEREVSPGEHAADGQAAVELAQLRQQLAGELESASGLLAQWEAHEVGGRRVLDAAEQHLDSARALAAHQAQEIEGLKLELAELSAQREKSAPATEDPSWQVRFERLSSEKSALEAELNEFRAGWESRLEAHLGASRAVEEGLKSRLERAESELRAATASAAALRERSAALEPTTRQLEEAQKSLQRSESLNAVLTQEKQAAEARGEALAAQIAELSGLVQEFVDGQGDVSHQEQIDSLTAELETVRVQADEDVGAMQTKLRASEWEIERLRQQMDSLCEQQLRDDVEREQLAEVPAGAGDRSPPWLRRVWSLVYALILLSLGAALLLALAAGTEDGKALSRRLIGAIEQGEPVSVDLPGSP